MTKIFLSQSGGGGVEKKGNLGLIVRVTFSPY